MSTQPPSSGPPRGTETDGTPVGGLRLPPPAPGSWNALEPPENVDQRSLPAPDSGLQSAIIVHRPQPYVPPPEPTSGLAQKLLIGTAIVAGLALSITALVFLTREHDDERTTPTTVTTVPAVTTAAPTTVAPATTTTEPAVVTTTTTEPETTTTVEPPPTTATLPPIPAGSADLGNGVGLPIPAGFVQTAGAPNAMVALTNNQSVIVAQTMVRPPGVSPQTVTQEYVAAFDPEFETIGYGPSVKSGTIAGDPAADTYTTFFATYDTATAVTHEGYISVSVRSDGLVLVLSVYGPSGVNSILPSEAVTELNASFQRAPLVGTPIPLTEFAPFRVISMHPAVAVDGLVAFSPTPRFRIVTSGNGVGLVADEVFSMQVDRLSGQVDTATVTAAAQMVITQYYTGVAYSQLWLSDPDPWGVVHGAFSWTGTYVQGQRSAGMIDFYFDPATGNAYVSYRTWFSGVDDANPYPSESGFMLRTLFTSFTGIP